ncbi:MAG: MBL fold metallo-hydrolase [Candidatus Marinimicrobia bacterium]|nr:MBL fold metallo-hydrolase [Candidatus Neomarinimicrobiota bacterium]
MKFTALPVKQGDSFLLKSDDKYLLVDGGGNQKHILTLLNNEKIKNKHIHYLACTHYDSDHYKGITGILKSGYFTFDELWLPEITGNIGYTINKIFYDILDYWKHHQKEINEMALDKKNGNRKKNTISRINNESKKEIENYERSVTNSIKIISENITRENFEIEDTLQLVNQITPSKLNKDLFQKLAEFCIISKHTINTGKKIIWLEYCASKKHTFLGNNVYVENAIKSGISCYSPYVFFKYLLLSKINQKSLVFCYDKKETPNVLFTADSDLEFYKTPIVLNDHSIVTAPHHGSACNCKAYCKISGSDLIFVKGYNNKVKNLSSIFLWFTQKYCTRCNTNPTNKQKVDIDYTKGIPPCVVGKPCICK